MYIVQISHKFSIQLNSLCMNTPNSYVGKPLQLKRLKCQYKKCFKVYDMKFTLVCTYILWSTNTVQSVWCVEA